MKDVVKVVVSLARLGLHSERIGVRCSFVPRYHNNTV